MRRLRLTWALFFGAAMVLGGGRAAAQNEYVASLNEQTLLLDRVVHVPGVTWVEYNINTFDQNLHRYFFFGNANNGLPFYLFTVPVAGGAVQPGVFCTATGDSLDQILTMQYDPSVDTLYAIYESHRDGLNYFSWVDPSTGGVHIRQPLSGYSGFPGSTYDIQNHWFITSTQGQILVIDARTGNVVFHPIITGQANVYNLTFDNATGKLYGVDGIPSVGFDSVSVSTGIAHRISSLPPLNGGEYPYTIDEKAGKYLFVGEEPGTSVCHMTRILTLDIQTGNILSNVVYPYADNTASAFFENAINFSMDNSTGTLYALNWHVTGAPAPDSAALFMTPDPLCQGDTPIFTAIAGQDIVAPSYLWTVNSAVAGKDSIGFIGAGLASGDTVRCRVISNPACNTPDTAWTDSIVVHFTDTTHAILSIATTDTALCPGTPVTFTATPVNGGTAPFFNWQINGVTAGADSAGFTTSTLTNGDQVRCILTYSGVCIPPAVSANTISIRVYPSDGPLALSIAASANPFCSGAPITVTADPSAADPLLSFQWLLNGQRVGPDTTVYVNDTFVSGDTLRCMMTSTQFCAAGDTAFSNPIILEAFPEPPPPSVTVGASSASICSGDTVTFTATPENGGASPLYQWMVDGNDTGPAGNVFSTDSISDGAIVSCRLTSSIACTAPVSSSNTVVLTVSPTPSVAFDPNTLNVPDGKSVQLNPIVGGAIASYRWTPVTGLSDPSIENPTATPSALIVYQLVVTATDGCAASAEIAVAPIDSLEMPSAFTPNGDGINDLFIISPYVPEQILRFSIFNRWGTLVFTTENRGVGWDGTSRGRPDPVGAYVWMIEYRTKTGKMMVSKGTVVLMR